MTDDATYVRNSCRLCGSIFVEKVISYSPSVPVDNYRPRLHKNIDLKAYGMDLYLCKSCGHAQLLDVVDPNILYGDYIYTSESSPGLKNHFFELVESVFKQVALSQEDLVVDVGCNDGLLLEFFRGKGCRTLGIDPSKAALELAKKKGLETVESFLTNDCAEKVVNLYGNASLVTATNVFSHADSLNEFASAVFKLLKNGGFFLFEVSYLKNLIFSGVWDYVYHEHLAHHSIKPLESFLRRIGFELISVEQLPIKGGSIRCIAQKNAAGKIKNTQIADLIVEEELLGLYDVDTYRRVEKFKANLKAVTDRVVSSIPERSMIASYGASATSTVLSQELGYAHRIAFVVDDNPKRQQTLTPGFLAPVLSRRDMERLNPALLIISAWRFRDNIVSQCDQYLKNGGKIYVPLPSPLLITENNQEVLEV